MVAGKSENVKRCKSCGAEIVWAITQSGKKTPLDAKPIRLAILDQNLIDDPKIIDGVWGYSSHFATCPNAEKHRRRK